MNSNLPNQNVQRKVRKVDKPQYMIKTTNMCIIVYKTKL